MPLWRNGQTRLTQNQVPKGVSVRVRLEAPYVEVMELADMVGEVVRKTILDEYYSRPTRSYLDSGR